MTLGRCGYRLCWREELVARRARRYWRHNIGSIVRQVLRVTGSLHRFRTRNDAIETRRMLSNEYENTSKIKEADRNSAAHNGLVAARVLPAQLRSRPLLKFALDHRTTNAHFLEGRQSSPEVRAKGLDPQTKQTDGYRFVPRCKAASAGFITLSSPVRFPRQPGRMPDGHLLTLHLFWFSMPIISGPAGRPL